MGYCFSLPVCWNFDNDISAKFCARLLFRITFRYGHRSQRFRLLCLKERSTLYRVCELRGCLSEGIRPIWSLRKCKCFFTIAFYSYELACTRWKKNLLVWVFNFFVTNWSWWWQRGATENNAPQSNQTNLVNNSSHVRLAYIAMVN